MRRYCECPRQCRGGVEVEGHQAAPALPSVARFDLASCPWVTLQHTLQAQGKNALFLLCWIISSM